MRRWRTRHAPGEVRAPTFGGRGAILLAAAATLGAVETTADAAVFDFHLSGDDWGLWVEDIEFDFTQTGVSANTGIIEFNQDGPLPQMGFDITREDGVAVTGLDVTNLMGSFSVADDGTVLIITVKDWNLWIQYDEDIRFIHTTPEDPPSINLDLDLVDVDGKHFYSATGLSHDFVWNSVDDLGAVTPLQRTLTTMELAFDLPLPAPSGAAALTVGGLALLRRRRA